MKTLIVTHIDMDGSGVEILFKKYRPDADVIRVNYGWEDDWNNLHKLSDHDEILFGDISFNPILAKKLNASGKKLILLDHHDSAITKFTESGTMYPWMILDTSRSGTKLVYDYLRYIDKSQDYTSYEDLVTLINDYDLWIHNDPRSIRLQFLWNGLGADKFVERFISNPLLDFDESELSIMESKSNELMESVKVAEDSMNSEPYVDCEGYKFNYCSNVPQFASLVSMLIQRNHPELDYLLLNSGRGSISVRSTEITTNHISEALGGGGHKLASGFPIKPTTDVVESVKNRRLVNYGFYSKFNK